MFDPNMPLTYAEAVENMGLVKLMSTTCRITTCIGDEFERWGFQTFSQHCQQLRKSGHKPCDAVACIEIASPALVDALTNAAMLS